MSKIRICDLCERKIGKAISFFKPKFSFNDGFDSEQEYDICVECVQEFKKFVKAKSMGDIMKI